jgi:hypothetical protein
MTSPSAPPGPLEDDPLDRPKTGTGAGAGRTQPPPSEHDTRTPIERILPELLRRGLEAGRGPLEKVSESIFPKDVASQLVDIRSGLVKAVAQEVGRFLREADIASEVRKILVGLDLEAQVKLRFKAREDGKLEPEVKVDVGDSEAPSERRKRR